MQPLRNLDSIEIFNGVITEALIQNHKSKAKFLKLKVLNRTCIILIADVSGNPIGTDMSMPSIINASQKTIDNYIVGSKVKIRNEIKIFNGKPSNHYTITENSFFNDLFESFAN